MAQDTGMFGTELRQAVSDPNADKAAQTVQPGSVPVGGVITPENADFSQVGKGSDMDVLSNLLGTSSSVAQEYFDKQKDQMNLDGQMAYAAGKTQDQIAQDGNQYTMAGFQSMKARVAANDWYQNSLNDINTSAKSADPATYMQSLSKSYAAMQDSVAGADPFTKNLMTTLATENFPKLAATQVAANNAWKQQQTMTSYSDMLVSESMKQDPASKETPEQAQQRIHQLTSPSYSGLPDELHREALTSAVQLSLKMGNDTLFKSLGTSEQTRIAAMNLGGSTPELNQAVQTVGQAPLQNAVKAVESNGDESAVSSAGAKGSMQVMDDTNTDPGFGVRPAADNSPEERARVGRDYLQAMMDRYKGNTTLALAAYNAGPGTVDAQIADKGNPGQDPAASKAFIDSFPFKETRDYVAKVNAQLGSTPGAATAVMPTGGTGASGGSMSVVQAKNAGGDTFNSASANAAGQGAAAATAAAQAPTPLNVANSSLTTKTSAMSALLRAGYTPAQVETISSAYTSFQDKKTQDYNAQRIMDEESIKVAAQQTGNLPAALNSITALKDKNGYSDAWANSMGEKAASEVQAGLLKRQGQVRLTNAVANNTLQQLSTEEIPQALTIARAQISGAVQGATPPAGMSQQDTTSWKQQQFRQKYADVLIKNGVTDPTWGASMNAAFEGALTGKDGTIRDNVQQAYDDYDYLSKTASPGYAQSFLSDGAKSIVSQIDGYAADGLNTSQAMRTVADIQARKAAGTFKAPTINDQDVTDETTKAVSQMTPGFFSMLDPFGSHYATNWWDLRPGDVDTLKQSPVLQSAVSSMAARVAQAHPEMTPAAAVGQAMNDAQSRADYVGNNIVIAGPKSSVRQDMGIQSTAQGAVNQAVQTYIQQNGHKIWGSKWDAQVSPIAQWRGYDEYGNPKYMVGNTTMGFPEFSATATAASVRDAIMGSPQVNVKYNPDSKTFTVDMYTNKEGTRTLNAPIILDAKKLGADYNAYQSTYVPKMGKAVNAVVDAGKAIGSGVDAVVGNDDDANE